MTAAAAAFATYVHQEPANFGTVWGIEALNGVLLVIWPRCTMLII